MDEVITRKKRTEKEISKPEDFTDVEVLHQRLFDTIREYHPSTDFTMIERAYQLAKRLIRTRRESPESLT